MTTYHLTKLQLSYLVNELQLAAQSSVDMFSISDEEYMADVIERVQNVEKVLEKVKSQINVMKQEKFQMGLVVNYKLRNQLKYDAESYDSNIRGEDVFISENEIEHLYITEVEASSPQEALEKVIDTLTLNKEFDFYNYEIEDDIWIEGILTKYEVGFLDDKLMFEYENIEQEIHAAS